MHNYALLDYIYTLSINILNNCILSIFNSNRINTRADALKYNHAVYKVHKMHNYVLLDYIYTLSINILIYNCILSICNSNRINTVIESTLSKGLSCRLHSCVSSLKDLFLKCFTV